MNRRTALRIIVLGAATPQVEFLKAAGHNHATTEIAWTPGEYKLRFFTEAENQLLDELMELIIPADGHSPGARAAKVSLFADLMVATGDDSEKAKWRDGLRGMREEAGRTSLAQALAKAAANETHPATELEKFFTLLKQMTINGYYTSEIGIQQDLEYQGNTYLAEFPGCAQAH